MTEAAATDDGARGTTTLGSEDLELRLEEHRAELTAYAYRMLGSAFEAEDAVQETLLRAWKSFDRFEGRAALRSWLYRIATNVCLDMLGGKERRARPMDLAPARAADSPLDAGLPEATWILPIPDGRLVSDGGDPAEVAESRETIRLAFIAALQHLPPKQRAVLILREVLRWKASEVAELLETSVPSVNSALQRARATLEATDVDAVAEPTDDEQRALLARYVDAFERYDMDSLTSLLRQDASWSMPPLRAVAADARRHPSLVPRPGHRLSRLALDPDLGERVAGVRSVQAGPGRRARAVVPPGPRDLRRADRGDLLLPRQRAAVPALRPAASARGVSGDRTAAPRPARSA